MKSYLLVRNERKQYGFQEHIEGNPLSKDEKLILLEDIINTGKSVQKTRDILNENNYESDSVLAFINFSYKKKICKDLKIYSVIELYEKKQTNLDNIL